MKSVRSFCFLAVTALLLQATSGTVHACAACFGKSDSNMAKGMNMGIFALLLVITCVLSGVASFFVYLGRRESQMQGADEGMTFSEHRTNA